MDDKRFQARVERGTPLRSDCSPDDLQETVLLLAEEVGAPAIEGHSIITTEFGDAATTFLMETAVSLERIRLAYPGVLGQENSETLDLVADDHWVVLVLAIWPDQLGVVRAVARYTQKPRAVH